jgi:acetoin utilization deacetylase AcuC-like enzyme
LKTKEAHKMTTAFITHPDTLLHVMDGSHPESPARITAITQAFTKKKLFTKLKRYEAPAATVSQLERVHSPAYVKNIYRLAPKAGLVRLDGDTAMGPMSLSAALHASGAVVLATDLVMQRQADNAFCCIRPPGHHAGPANSAGFCIFNHVAVGVAHAIAAYPLKRVAIIDFDVHHGDGTEAIFKDDPRVMLCSTFQHPFYPHRGHDSRTENMINVPLPAKSGSADIRQVFEQVFLPALHGFKPELIFISAGFDAHQDDPLADLAFTTEDYAWMTTRIKEIAQQHAQGRIVSSLEGGYHLHALAEAATAHVEALL